MGWLKKMTGGAISTPKTAGDWVATVATSGANLFGLPAVSKALQGKKVNTSGEEAQQAQAVQEYLAALAEYKETGFIPYEFQGELQADFLEDAKQLDDTTYKEIKTNPIYDQYTQDALRGLEEQATQGLTARDRADLAQLESDVNRQNAGRIGAIRQNMDARGLGGGGQDIVMQMQAAQDATDRQALAALEKAAQAQTNRQNATTQLGNMAAGLQSQQFNQEAQKAAAQDAINQFNVNNTNQRQVYNNTLANQVNQQNWNARQNVADANTEGRNQHNQNVLSGAATGAGLTYNQASDTANRKIAQNQANQQNFTNQLGALGSLAGGAALLFSDEEVKEDIQEQPDDDIEAFLNSIKPKQYGYKGDDKTRHGVIAQDLEHSKIGSDMIRDVNGVKAIDTNDLLGALLQSVAHLNKKVGA